MHENTTFIVKTQNNKFSDSRDSKKQASGSNDAKSGVRLRRLPNEPHI